MSAAAVSRPKRQKAPKPEIPGLAENRQKGNFPSEENRGAQGIGSPRDLGILFPIKTHALNTSDHGLIEKAREVTEREVWARKIADESGDGDVPEEAATVFSDNADAVLEMAKVEATTWDGWIARQVAFAAFFYVGEVTAARPDAGAEELAEAAAGRDVLAILEGKTTYDRPKEHAGETGRALSDLITSGRVLDRKTDGMLTLFHCLIVRIKSGPFEDVDRGWLLPALEAVYSDISHRAGWFSGRLTDAEFGA